MSKYLVAAVHQSSGNAKATGNPYAIPRANVLTPFQNRQSANQVVSGIGFSCIELTVSEHFYPELSKHFAANFKGFPLELDFETGLDREGRNVLIGFEKPVSKASDYTATKMGS